MKDYRTLEDFPVTYQRQFAPAVKEMLREWDRDNEDGPIIPNDHGYTIDDWLVETSFDIADRRFGIPTVDHPSGEEKHFRMMDWRTFVEKETLRLLKESGKA